MNHVELLRRLLPSSYDKNGAALNIELVAEGNALDLAQWSADQLLLEMDPRTATLTLADWERVYGLPDTCVAASGLEQSIAERRVAVVSLKALQGGQSKAFYIALAAELGYTITIDELHPQTTEDDTEYPIQDEQYRYIWVVHSALYNLREKTTEDDTEMATAVWGNTLLECRINRFKPSHTHVMFAYS